MSAIKEKDNNTQSYNYQSKIRDQAKRLCSQEKYISLLEERLLQYNPSESFPVTQNSLSPIKTSTQTPPELQLKYNQLQQKYNLLAETISKNNSEKKGKELLQSQLKDSDNIYELYNHQVLENQRLEKEKNEISLTLKTEIINNDEQLNQIEILKQTIESSLIQSGLKTKIDLLKQKYYQSDPNGDYAKIILDITSMKSKNDDLMNQCNNMKKELKRNDLFKDKVQKSIDLSMKELDNATVRIASLEKENAILLKELSSLTLHNKSITSELDKTINERNDLSKDKEVLSTKLTSLEQSHDIIKLETQDTLLKLNQIASDKKELNESLHDLKVQNEIMKNEKCNSKNQTEQFYTTVTVLQEKYDTLLHDFYEVKKMNQQLMKENSIFDNECSGLKGQLYKLNDFTCVENENKKLFNDLSILQNQYLMMKDERESVENYYKGKIEEIVKDKMQLESTVYQKDNDIHMLKECHDNLRKYQDDFYALNNQNALLNEQKTIAMNENNFYYNFLMKVIKCLIGNKQLQHMLLDLIELNIKLIGLSFEKEKNPSLIDSKDTDKLYSHIIAIENEVKRYEICSS